MKRTHNLPLIQFLSANSSEPLLCCTDQPIAGLTLLPFRSLKLISEALFGDSNREKVALGRWRSENWWATQEAELFSDVRIALFDCRLQEIPNQALIRLTQAGCRQLIFRSEREWMFHTLEPRSLTFSERAIEAARLIRLRVAMVVRALVLKGFATDLRKVADGAIKREQGHCFRVTLPTYEGASEKKRQENSCLLLFEETRGLVGRQSHDVIRGEGSGRYSHWERTLFFSTMDDSDPNENGLRYRIIDITRQGRLVRLLLRLSKSLDLDPGQGVREHDLHLRSRWGATRRFRGLNTLPISKRLWWRATPLRTLVPPYNFYEELQREIAHDRDRHSLHRTKASHSRRGVALCIDSLASGGAERQAVYVARGLSERGSAVTVITRPFGSEAAYHYLPLLDEVNVPHDVVREITEEEQNAVYLAHAGRFERLLLLTSVPDEIEAEMWRWLVALHKQNPLVVHCWLDYSNTLAGMAAWFAEVPHIVLSTRNKNPSNFPSFHQEWFQSYYRLLSQASEVQLVANSRAGAIDYAQWIGISSERFQVVYNGFDPSVIAAPSAERVQHFRHELGIPSDAPVIAGVFRLQNEKRPLFFADVVADVLAELPSAYVILAGVGDLEDALKIRFVELGIAESVRLLGRRDDIPLVMSAAQLLLLTSRTEGLPNVLIEAQYLARPVVAGNVGGVAEVVDDGVGGFLCQADDRSSFVARSLLLLRDPQGARAMGIRGRESVERRFSLDRMLDATVNSYHLRDGENHRLSRPRGGERPVLAQRSA